MPVGNRKIKLDGLQIEMNIDLTPEAQVNLIFDENIVLRDITTNFIVSPPLETEPDVKVLGKEIKVEFPDDLQKNTTYTIYFGECITDNNEGNAFKNYAFSFSTGAVMDT